MQDGDDHSVEGHRRAVRALTEQLGPEHPETIKKLFVLGFSLQRSGRLEEAGREYRIVLRTLVSTLGDDHPDTLAGRVNHGLMLDRLGRLEEAEQEQLTFLETAERLPVPDDRHLLFSVCRSNLEATRHKLQD
jgi:hypothetical protein